MKKKVLFVCIHNSARSQMAEAFLNQLGGEVFAAESAGIEPGHLNPIVVAAMKELEIDISQNETNSVQSFIDSGNEYDFVITVCDEASAERCPVFPGGSAKRVHIGFPDPSGLAGNDDEKLVETRVIRDQIKIAIEKFIADYS